jgi:hypothetical protein
MDFYLNQIVLFYDDDFVGHGIQFRTLFKARDK